MYYAVYTNFFALHMIHLTFYVGVSYYITIMLRPSNRQYFGSKSQKVKSSEKD
jgi:uncharacterized membrane protein